MEPKREQDTPTTPPPASDAAPDATAPSPEPTAAPPPATHPPVAPTPTASTSGAQATAGKADLGKRFIAMLIDAVLAAVVSLIPFVGWIVAGAYMIVRDGLELDFMDRRSLGKKIMKLRPVRLDNQPMDIETSFKRNWMWAIGYLAAIPIIGWILSPVLGLVALGIGIFEIYKVVSNDDGRRWGDGMAGTKVIEVAD